MLVNIMLKLENTIITSDSKTNIYGYNSNWAEESDFLNLSFNKINIYKDLYDEFKMNFVWIDLDTFICSDISYLDDLPNIFLEMEEILLTLIFYFQIMM